MNKSYRLYLLMVCFFTVVSMHAMDDLNKTSNPTSLKATKGSKKRKRDDQEVSNAKRTKLNDFDDVTGLTEEEKDFLFLGVSEEDRKYLSELNEEERQKEVDYLREKAQDYYEREIDFEKNLKQQQKLELLKVLAKHLDVSMHIYNPNRGDMVDVLTSNKYSSDVKKVLVNGKTTICTYGEYERNISCLFAAIKKDNLEKVELLLDHGADVNQLVNINKWRDRAKEESKIFKFKQTALHVAVEQENIEIIELLLKHKANVCAQDTDGNTPLHTFLPGLYDYSDTNKALKIIQMLKKVDQKVLTIKNNEGELPLHMATGEGCDNREVIEELITEETGNAQDENGLTPLQVAVMAGHTKTVKILLDQKEIDYDVSDKKGNSLVHLAAQYARECRRDFEGLETCCETDMLKLLFVYTEIDVPNNAGKTALHIAVETNNFDAVKTLLEAGAYVNAEDKKGQAPLHKAVSDRYDVDRKIIELLIEYKASPNMQDRQHNTPLHLAAKAGNYELVDYLLKNGADNGIVENKKGKTVFDYALDGDSSGDESEKEESSDESEVSESSSTESEDSYPEKEILYVSDSSDDEIDILAVD